jgi:hypothetical protein
MDVDFDEDSDDDDEDEDDASLIRLCWISFWCHRGEVS